MFLSTGLLLAALAAFTPWMPGPRAPAAPPAPAAGPLHVCPAAQEPGEPEAPQPAEPQTPARDGKQLEADGWEAFNAGETARAERLFRRAVDAGRTQAWRGVAECARRDERWDAAARAWHALLEHDPEDAEARLALAQTHAWSGNHAAARTQYGILLATAEDETVLREARRGLADVAAWSGSHRDAWDRYRAALEEDPRDVAALRGLAELESWKERHGHAAVLYERALAEAPGDAAIRAGLERARAELAPTVLLQVQHFSDEADWERRKALGGIAWSPAPESAPGWRLFLGAEEAEYEQADGRTASRTSFVTRQVFRPSPFTRVHADFAVGHADDETTYRGGLGTRVEASPRTHLWASWRHDDFIDPIAPHDFDRYNGAFTVDLERGDVLQANTWRGGVLHETAPHRGVLADLLAGEIEDGNRRFESYLQAHRGREWSPGVVGIGRVFYHHSDYASPSNDYFAPSNLDSWGIGGRVEWERGRWEGHGDASGFWQASGVAAWGWQLEAGLFRRMGERGRVGLMANYLSTDERGLPERYEAFAVLFLATLDL